MPINFPNNPTLQVPTNVFSPTSTPLKTENGVTYTWDGEKWVAYTPSLEDDGASVEVGPDAPSDPNPGDLWWDSSDDSGRLYVWYEDIDTKQWVDASPDSLGQSVNSGVNWPATAAVNDLFFRTSDGRLYIYYEDDDSSQWIDASPDSPAPTYWEKNGSNLSPAEDTDNVVIGGDKITLNATNGSGLFEGWATFKNTGLNDAVVNILGSSGAAIQSSRGGVNTAQLQQDGTLWLGGTLPSEPKISLNADGSALFSGAGGVMVYQSPDDGVGIGLYAGVQIINTSTTANTAFQLKNSVLGVNTFQITGNGRCFSTDGYEVRDSTGAVDKIKLNNDGSARFAGSITSTSSDEGFFSNTTLSHATSAFRSYSGDAGASTHYHFYAGTTQGISATIATDGSAVFKGAVQTAGGVVTPSMVLRLEADDDTKYTSTTDAYGNETRVYNGATLDVKERVLNLVARLDAIEANEMIDDATDTSLLQLLASANTRLDSIELRLAALEGVSN